MKITLFFLGYKIAGEEQVLEAGPFLSRESAEKERDVIKFGWEYQILEVSFNNVEIK